MAHGSWVLDVMTDHFDALDRGLALLCGRHEMGLGMGWIAMGLGMAFDLGRSGMGRALRSSSAAMPLAKYELTVGV